MPRGLALALAVSLPGAFARTDGAAAPRPTRASASIADRDRRDVPAQRARRRCMRRSRAAWRRTSSASTSGARSDGKRRRLRPADRLEVLRRRATTRRNTVQLTNKLVLQDKVFAIVGTLGTEQQPDPAVPEPAQDPADPRLDRRELLGPAVQAVPVDDRLAARLHRGRASRTGAGSRRTRRTRRSRSSTRTTTTARTTSRA